MLAESFARLIHQLVETHHDGKLLAMAARAGLSPACLSLWRSGITRQPDPRSIQRLCAAYGLEEAGVVGLVMADLGRQRDGQPVPVPDSDRGHDPGREPPPVLAESFALLIHQLAETHHAGKLLPMAARAGLSHGCVSAWRCGITRQPDSRSIQRLCAAYGLEEAEVVGLVMADLRRLRDGQPVPVPDMTDVRPGPVAGRPRGSLRQRGTPWRPGRRPVADAG